MAIKVYRQGDVALVPIEALPAAAKPSASRLLRRGEHGGLHLLERKAPAQLFVGPVVRARRHEGGEAAQGG